MDLTTRVNQHIIRCLAEAMENALRKADRAKDHAEASARYLSEGRLNSVEAYHGSNPFTDLSEAMGAWRDEFRTLTQIMWHADPEAFEYEQVLAAVKAKVSERYQAQLAGVSDSQWQ